MKKILLVLLVLLGQQTQAQINLCDSLSYTAVDLGQGMTVTGESSGLDNMADSIEWIWTACNSTTCFTGTGDTYNFWNILTTDTVKLCYDAYVYSFDTIVCTHCDSLVYDFMTDNWMLMNISNPTTIKELISYNAVGNKTYDVLGRKWTCSFANLPKGLYIINNKKVLKTE